MSTKSILRIYLARVVRRPRPWIVWYLLLTLPALFMVPLVAFPLRPWFRVPLWLEALDTRSLDALIESLMHPVASGGPLLALALIALPFAWLIVLALRLLTEGGVLATYALPDAPDWRGFGRACFRWLGSFLLMALLGTVIVAILVGLAIISVLLLRRTWRPVGLLFGVLAMSAIVIARFWMELSRAAAVVRDDRHVIRALRYGGRLLRRYPLPLLGLGAGTAIVRWLVILGSRRLVREVPLSWWLLTLFVQQIVQVVTMGLPLARKAGEVGWAVRLFDERPTTPSGAPAIKEDTTPATYSDV
jgi:hypothetical protein